MTTPPSPLASPAASSAPDEISAKVLEIIRKTKGLPADAVTAESSFEALGIDSLDRLNILFDLENEFEIQINDEEARQVTTIEQMIAGVRQLVEARSGGGSGVSAAESPAAPAAEESDPRPGGSSAAPIR